MKFPIQLHLRLTAYVLKNVLQGKKRFPHWKDVWEMLTWNLA